jgi:hypothetical protein
VFQKSETLSESVVKMETVGRFAKVTVETEAVGVLAIESPLNAVTR